MAEAGAPAALSKRRFTFATCGNEFGRQGTTHWLYCGTSEEDVEGKCEAQNLATRSSKQFLKEASKNNIYNLHLICISLLFLNNFHLQFSFAFSPGLTTSRLSSRPRRL